MNISEYVEVKDNLYLHIRDWGAGKTIVFISGWPFGHEMFEYQFMQLPQRGYRCIGISMRGFGKSSKPWGEYSYDTFADDLQSVLQALDLSDVTLVGFSMGGAIALRYMARHKGDRIANLVLCSAAAPCFTKRTGFPFGLEPGVVDSLIELSYSDRARLNADFGALFFKDSTTVSPPLMNWFQSLGMEASAHATTACLVTLRDSDLRDDIHSVHVPTILFHGVHDRICLFELAETMTAPAKAMPTGGEAMAVGGDAMSAGEEPTAGGIKAATLIRFENSGHALFYEERVKFNEELINFIEKKAFKEDKFFGPATR
jgi:pimeloyl-ACP methyl ester carboxylesterase